jgi:peptidoglycan/xylan/chitin deacetylase (PgdA/CDA1 family)
MDETAIDTFLLFSVDLEQSPSKSGGREHEDSINQVFTVLFDILNKYDIVGTFFVDGETCIRYPEIVKDLHSNGHEIGAHGFYHESLVNFWPLAMKPMPKLSLLNRRVQNIRMSKKAIHNIIGVNPVCFRAPYLAIDGKTLKILESEGFLLDSSLYNPVFGKLSYPYHPSEIDPSCEGKIKLLEVPITVSLIPYRKFFYWRYPHIFELEEKDIKKTIQLVKTAFLESNYPFALFVTLIHPWELRSPKIISKIFHFLTLMKGMEAISITASQLLERTNK